MGYRLQATYNLEALKMIISLKDRIADILKETPLPKAKDVTDESQRLAAEINIGRTKFMDKYDVSSELEYKRRCVKEGRIMYHAHIGMNTWDAVSYTHLDV